MEMKKKPARVKAAKKATSVSPLIPIAAALIMLSIAIIALYLPSFMALNQPSPTPAPTATPAMATPAQQPTATPIFCGGIAGFQCPEGFHCQLDGCYPDAGGICVPGPGAEQCPTPGAAQSPTPGSLAPAPEDIRELTILTDKQVYHPSERMVISVYVTSARQIQGAEVVLVGIRSSRGYDYLNQHQSITLLQGRNEINYTMTLPSCSPCSGVSYGAHDFNVSIAYNGTMLKGAVATIEMQPAQ